MAIADAMPWSLARQCSQLMRRPSLVRPMIAFAPGGMALTAVFAAALGSCVYLGLPGEPEPLVVRVCALCAVVLALMMHLLGASPLWRTLVICIATSLCGAAWCQVHAGWASSPTLSGNGGAHWVTGWVERIDPPSEDRNARLTLRVVEISNMNQTPKRVRVTAVSPEAQGLPGLGDGVRVRAWLAGPPGPATPGGYDFARNAYFGRLGGVGRALEDFALTDLPLSGFEGLQRRLARVRAGVAAAVFQSACQGAGLQPSLSARDLKVCAPGVSPITEPLSSIEIRRRSAGALVAVVITGERSQLPVGASEALRAAGLGHILAISGLHMALVAGGAFGALSLGLAAIPQVARGRDIRRWAAAGALMVAVAYLVVSGAAVSTQRAFVMASVVMMAVILRRRALSLHTVALAGVVVLLIAPQSAAGPGFQMSFAATTALIAGYRALERRRQEHGLGQAERRLVGRVGGAMVDLSRASFIAGLATGPFAAFHFNRIAVFGLGANLAAMPIFSFWVMPLAVVAGILAFIGQAIGAPWLGGLFAWLAGAGAALVIVIAEGVAAAPHALRMVASAPALALALVVAGLVAVCVLNAGRILVALPIGLLGSGLWLLGDDPDVWLGADGRVIVFGAATAPVATEPSYFGDYRRDVVLRRSGIDGELTDVATFDQALRCDRLGCVATVNNTVLAFPTAVRSLPDDCTRADLVIVRDPDLAKQVSSLACGNGAVLADQYHRPLTIHVEHGRWQVREAQHEGRPWSPPYP